MRRKYKAEAASTSNGQVQCCSQFIQKPANRRMAELYVEADMCISHDHADAQVHKLCCFYKPLPLRALYSQLNQTRTTLALST